ncbi:hypothetical protein [Actinomadura bangladeshensis]|uniref:Uncharacterized protein n=1 Tax=Actinomadura bangladeshensis TaxID=453573 RepID=A0A4R4NYZ9_9ACTN|nr:hypothetical protein [Actinomadura bangladeshensis]TDC14825.1 hypothetical protein E1284_17095 [Actinomadura bangladeshensis]
MQRPEGGHCGPGAPRRLAGPSGRGQNVRRLRVQPGPHLGGQRRGAPVERVEDALRLAHVPGGREGRAYRARTASAPVQSPRASMARPASANAAAASAARPCRSYLRARSSRAPASP